jgi:hypothetical protein
LPRGKAEEFPIQQFDLWGLELSEAGLFERFLLTDANLILSSLEGALSVLIAKCSDFEL